MKKVFLLIFLSLLISINAYSASFQNALKLYKTLKSSKVKNKTDFSSIVIQEFYTSYVKSKRRKTKAFSLFMIGKTYLYLTKVSKNGDEIFADLTISSFMRVIREFPESSLCDDSLYYIAYVYYYYKNNPSNAIQILYNLLSNYPNGDYYKKAKRFIRKILRKYPKLRKKIKKVKYKGVLKKIRCFSRENFLRIVFDVNKPVKYIVTKFTTEVDVQLNKVKLSKYFKIKNNLNFISIQKDNSNIKAFITPGKIVSVRNFILTNPFRIVVDIEFQRIKKEIFKIHRRIETIVIDPGHGGKDPGAIYYGLAEKDVVLKVAKILKKILKKKLPYPKYRIYLTRETDKYIYLEDRVKYANQMNADLFVSIHCNAARDPRLSGVQTFYLDPYKYRFNIASTNDIDYIINDLMRMAKLSESIKFAKVVHEDLLKTLRRRYRYVHDHGVKKAPFYVLVNTKMPSILVEISFISNPMENKRLRNNNYLKCIAEGIAEGIVDYINTADFVK